MRRKKGLDFWDDFFAPLQEDEALSKFGLASGATEKDVKRAFREKAHEAHSNGDFTGDMDKLVQAKEQALKSLNKLQ